jgi:hypothetical protein
MYSLHQQHIYTKQACIAKNTVRLSGLATTLSSSICMLSMDS